VSGRDQECVPCRILPRHKGRRNPSHRVFTQSAIVSKRRNRYTSGCVVDEDAARPLPKVAIFIAIVDQSVARMAVLIFQSCSSSDDRHAGEVSFRPTALLRLGPLSSRKPGQDDGIEMPNGLVQVHRIGQQIQFGEEVWHGYKLAPELLKAELLLKLARRLPQNRRCGFVELGKYAITIQEDSGYGELHAI
jgi:hypothetical protein